VERPAAGGPEGARVLGEPRLNGRLSVSERFSVESGGLAVTGDSEAEGDVALRGDLRVQPEEVEDGWAARIEGTGEVDGVLQVGDSAKVLGGGLHAAGDGAVGGTLTVSERLTASSSAVNGTLLVLGDVVAPNLEVLPLLGPDGDTDGDWVENARDVCVFTPDPEQEDYDEDGRGDACDPDADGDGSANVDDCLPLDEGAVGPDGRPDTTCDGIDDDCDGELDEEFVPGDCDTGEPGICAVGLESCVGMELWCVQQHEPEDDDPACDGLDSDCDGELDEDYVPVACDSGLPGICADGETVCEDGAPQCVPDIAPDEVEEICDDDLDNDCDGEVDDGCRFDFAASQEIDGRTVRCGSVSNTDAYFQCNDLTVNGHYFPNRHHCDDDWKDEGPDLEEVDMIGFCQALGGSGRLRVRYAGRCEPFATRITWKDHRWGTVLDNGWMRHLICYR